MTKLEEKLEELGYKKEIKKGSPMRIYHKFIDLDEIMIITWLDREIYYYSLDPKCIIRTQQDLDRLQQVLNIMFEDLSKLFDGS